MPKEHAASSLEIEEEVQRDLQSLKKTLARFWKNQEGGASEADQKRTIFVETSFEQELVRNHLMIDAVAVPPTSDVDFDLELVIQKALLEGDSEWNRSTARKLIDTRA